MIPEQANKIVTENGKYVANAGYVITTTKASEAVNVAFNEGIDACIKKLSELGRKKTIPELEKLKA